MIRAMYTPMSVQSHVFVGTAIALELHRRIHRGSFGAVPQSLWEDAWGMHGYCLDAHDVLPAGSVEYDWVGPTDDDWIWSPTTCMREPAGDGNG